MILDDVRREQIPHTFVLFNTGQDALPFYNYRYINTQQPNVTFTREREEENHKLPFLNALLDEIT